jgi:hypothetical protein
MVDEITLPSAAAPDTPKRPQSIITARKRAIVRMNLVLFMEKSS